MIPTRVGQKWHTGTLLGFSSSKCGLIIARDQIDIRRDAPFDTPTKLEICNGVQINWCMPTVKIVHRLLTSVLHHIVRNVPVIDTACQVHFVYEYESESRVSTFSYHFTDVFVSEWNTTLSNLIDNDYIINCISTASGVGYAVTSPTMPFVRVLVHLLRP